SEGRRQDGRDQGFARGHGFPTAGRNRCDPRGTPGRCEAGRRRRGAKQSMSTVAQTTATAAMTGNSALGPVKRIDAGVLNVVYAEAGPSNGRTVILFPCRLPITYCRTHRGGGATSATHRPRH